MKTKGLLTITALALLATTVVGGCGTRGTDEAGTYVTELVPAGQVVTYAEVSKFVLQPYCLRCHQEFGSETGFTARDAYQMASSGEMPPGGPQLSAVRLSLLKRYSEGSAGREASPPAAVNPPSQVEPALAPTYASLSVRLVKQSCLKCHGAVNPKKGISLHTFDDLRDHSEKVLEVLADDSMPTKRSGLPKVKEEVKAAFRAWVDGGFEP